MGIEYCIQKSLTPVVVSNEIEPNAKQIKSETENDQVT